MTEEEKEILAFAQSVYRARTGAKNDIEDDEEELSNFIDDTIDWVNQFIDELQDETDWNYVRRNGVELGRIRAAGATTFPLPDEVRKLVVSPYREVTITQDGSTIATFKLVHPNQITDPANPDPDDRAIVLGRNIIFSRPFTEEEVGGVVKADVVDSFPILERDSTEVLSLVQPKRLLVLGTAMNMSLPDLVQGDISPELERKYTRALQKAVATNDESAESDELLREDLSFIRGVF